MNENYKIEQNLLKHLYEVKYNEQKSWRDIHNKNKETENGITLANKIKEMRMKKILIPNKTENIEQNSLSKTLINYETKIPSHSRQKKSNSKKFTKKDKDIQSFFKNRCHTVLDRHRDNSFFSHSKTITLTPKQQFQVTGLKQKFSEKQFDPEGGFTNRKGLKIQKIRIKRKSPTYTPNSGNRLKAIKKVSQFEVKPWNFAEEEDLL